MFPVFFNILFCIFLAENIVEDKSEIMSSKTNGMWTLEKSFYKS